MSTKTKRKSIFNDPAAWNGVNTISDRAYNAIIGLVLLWGIGLSTIICLLFSDSIVGLITSSDSYVVPILILAGYLVLTFVGNMISANSNNPFISFVGYNMVVIPTSMILSIFVSAYATASIIMALEITLICIATMMLLSTLFPQFFLSIGRTLFIALIIAIVVEVILALTGALGSTSEAILDSVVALIFCGYIGFDWARAQRCTKTVDNAVDVCVALYMDIINLFIRILSIVGRKD